MIRTSAADMAIILSNGDFELEIVWQRLFRYLTCRPFAEPSNGLGSHHIESELEHSLRPPSLRMCANQYSAEHASSFRERKNPHPPFATSSV
ncbi:hypothetical protein Pr1d_31260 [Bythopirellula goksoeyrii]|uniref:Uncharacterized protein n=1 Tax=Bythopirellula goksoeyrii TaxID=1400387 RepID=A0A5B9QDW3_9BACT|nr:hypothetical protein Pr1d_31260 [Bythopirellula goksoeyrii]